MEYRYKPSGVCSREMIFDIEDNIVSTILLISVLLIPTVSPLTIKGINKNNNKINLNFFIPTLLSINMIP